MAELTLLASWRNTNVFVLHAQFRRENVSPTQANSNVLGGSNRNDASGETYVTGPEATVHNASGRARERTHHRYCGA